MADFDSQVARTLPPVNDVLGAPELSGLILERGRETVRGWVRDALGEVRLRLTDGALNGAPTREMLVDLVTRAVHERAGGESGERLGRVINATGVILHTSLGRAPLAAAAVTAMCEAAAACNLEVDLCSGERRARGYQLQSAWQRLTGAEASLVVNNNAAATVLALDALARGREVIISRGQLIEIGGSFRLPEIFAQSGAILREVGTTNRTQLADYQRAIGPDTAAILRVHPSNFRVVGFAETPGIADLAALAQRHGLLCLDDIGSGCLVDTTRFGLPAEPTFQASLAAGADMVLGSGDKLLGGPQCGILLGRAELVGRLRDHALARALRVDKVTLAALSATLDLYLRGTAEQEVPVLSLLSASPESLFTRATQIRDAITTLPPHCKGGPGGVALQAVASMTSPPHPGADAPGSPGAARELTITVARDTAPVGGGSLPGAALPTAVLRLSHSHLSADDLARRLRLGPPRVFGRIQENEVVLDLRSVMPEEDETIAAALRRQIESAVAG